MYWVALADHAQTAVTDTSLSKRQDEFHEAPERIAISLIVLINGLDDDTKRIIIKFADNFKQQETTSIVEEMIKIQWSW